MKIPKGLPIINAVEVPNGRNEVNPEKETLDKETPALEKANKGKIR